MKNRTNIYLESDLRLQMDIYIAEKSAEGKRISLTEVIHEALTQYLSDKSLKTLINNSRKG